MSGGKGGSTTSTVEVPQYIEDAARRNLERADLISKIGYVPYYGPEVAAMTPAQEAAFASTQQLGSAFGLPTTLGTSALPSATVGIRSSDFDMGVPAPQTFAGGVRGYSSAPMFEEAMDEFGRRRPAQKAFIDSLFIDPFSGAFTPISTTPLHMGEVVDTTTTTPVNTTTTTGGGGGGGGGSSIIDSGVGNVGGTGFTTYGGSQDVANQAVVDAFADFGQQVSDAVATGGTVNVEDNPAFNAGIKAANENEIVTYLTNDNQIVSKKKGDLTSADFNNAAKIVDQNRLAADSMLAAGIRNVGGGFAQDDPTTGLLGSLTDTKNFITSEIADAAEAARKAARDRRRKRDAKKGTGAFAKRAQKTGVGGRNIGGR